MKAQEAKMEAEMEELYELSWEEMTTAVGSSNGSF
jgi:hypothetical protein